MGKAKRNKKLISLSAVAWNIAAAPEETRQQKLLEVIQLLPEFKHITEKDDLISLANSANQEEPSDAAVMLHILQGMMRRKFELYPNDDRIVVDYWLESKLEDDVLQVKALVPNAEK